MNKRVTIILAFSPALLLGVLLFLSQSVSVSGDRLANQELSLPDAALLLQAPTVQFSIGSQSELEKDSPTRTSLVAQVELTPVSTQTVTVPFVVSGTADAQDDYVITTTSPLVIPAGVSSADIIITVIGDDLDENDETVELTLGTPTNAGRGTPNKHTLTIRDDDPEPEVSFSTDSFNVNEDQTSAQIMVTLDRVSGRQVRVEYATSNGTAVAGDDYVAANRALIFYPGETNKSFWITIIDDDEDEDNGETVNLTLDNPDNAGLGRAFARLSIDDNDGAPTVGFSSATYNVDEDDGTATIQVTLDALSGRTVTVDYETSPATATEWDDYRPVAGTLTFDPGQTSQSFAVTIINDNVNEDDREELILTLSNVSNVNLGAAQATLTIVDDDVGPTATISPTPPGIPGIPDKYEPNYDFGRATLIGLDEYPDLNFVPWVGSNPDNDFYKLWVVAGKLYTCETYGLGTATNTNMILYSGPGQEYGFAGNDDVEPFDPEDPYRSRLTFFSSYNGYVYMLLGQVGADRILPEEWKNLSYGLRCFIGEPGTATPTPTSQFVPPTPRPTSVPAQNTPLPSPTQVQLVVLPMTTPTPPSPAVPVATPTPELYVIELSLYYDRNGNAQTDPGEGIVDVLARAHDAIGGDLMSIDYTDETGRLRFTVPGKGPVRVSVPFFGFDQIVTARDTSIQIRISPRP